jgi:hypothetical protein
LWDVWQGLGKDHAVHRVKHSSILVEHPYEFLGDCGVAVFNLPLHEAAQIVDSHADFVVVLTLFFDLDYFFDDVFAVSLVLDEVAVVLTPIGVVKDASPVSFVVLPIS